MDRPVTHMEEFVEYHVYCTDVAVSQEIFAKKKELVAVETALTQKALALMTLLEPFTKAYMWQDEAFCLKVWSTVQRDRWCSQKAYRHLQEAPPHLYGRIKVGECVDDEWFVVFLLRYLSEHCPELIISVVDGDGDFLLIEGAYELPKWMAKPSMSVNRVFLSLGRLMLIPSALGPSDPGQIGNSGQEHQRIASLGVSDALALVMEHGAALGASLDLEKSVFRRVDDIWRRMDKQKSEISRGCREGFILQEQHTAWAYVPHRVAIVLREHVELIPPAVRAMGFADPVAVKKCKDLPFSFPAGAQGNGRESDGKRKPDLLIGSGEMTWVPVTLSRLLFAQLLYHRVAIPASLQWTKPGTPPTDDRISKGKELGARLTVALEMLYWEGDRQRASERAAAHRHCMCSVAERKMDQKPPEYGSPGEDDDDSWLYVSPADVDDMLHEAMAGVASSAAAAPKTGGTSAAASAAAAMGQFSGMTEGLKKFLSASSSYKGVEAFGEGGSSGSDEDDRFYDGPGEEEEEDGEDLDGLDPFASLSELREKLFKMEEDVMKLDDLSKEELQEREQLRTFVDMMHQLDSELAGHEKLADFASPPAEEGPAADDTQYPGEVDIDLNLAKNLVELYEEGSGAGSALPNLLHTATFSQMYDLD